MDHVDYLKPRSLDEVHMMLNDHGNKARILAGGTDLIARLKQESKPPDYLISIDSLQDLDYIIDGEDSLRIGALTRIHDIAISPVIKEKYPLLRQAAGVLGTPSIRRQATIGGNLCNASPCADTAPPLLVMGAQLIISTPDGEQTIPVEGFFKGPGLTSLGSNEILKEIRVPSQGEGSKGAYLKMTRSQGADLAIVSVAALMVMEGDTVKDAKIALGSVAPAPIRVKKAEKTVSGKKLDVTLLNEAAEAAQAESKPIDDVRGSAEYRNKLVETLVKRAIRQAADIKI